MNLIKKINKTVARTKVAENMVGAGAVGAVMMPLFSTLVGRSGPKKAAPKRSKKKAGSLGIAEAYRGIVEAGDPMNPDGESPQQSPNSNFDPAGVISKLKGLEAREKTDNRDTVVFGLEDDNGGLVRVTVNADQAAEFEKVLQTFLMDSEEEDEEVPEIAEILFKLKDQFSIVDVVWPDVEEDEEQDVDLQGAGGAEGDPAADLGQGEGDGSELDPSLNAGTPAGEDPTEVKSLLTQVIDMMRADADARKAEAQAKQAESKVREADAVAAQSAARVKQEEQYLDMDSYNKDQKTQERESKRLAQLAKWRHDMARDQGVDAPDSDGGLPVRDAVENEETTHRRPPGTRAPVTTKAPAIRGRVHPHDIAAFILNRVK